MKASVLISLLKGAMLQHDSDIEVYHWSGYEPIATRNFKFEFHTDPPDNLITHYGAKPHEAVIVLEAQ